MRFHLDPTIQTGTRVLVAGPQGEVAKATVVRIIFSEGNLGGVVEVRRDGSRRLWAEAGNSLTTIREG